MKSLSKIYFVIVLILVSIFPTKISNGCFDPGPYFVGYSILHPNISEGEISKPLVFTYTYFGSFWHENGFKEKKIDKNIIEWQKFFFDVPKYKDLNFIIYESKIEGLEKLKKLQFNPNATIPDTIKNSSFSKTFKQYNFASFLDYLIFAKKCEPHLIGHHYWKKDISILYSIDSLIEKGIKNYNNVKNDFLKLRYGYQILRLSRKKNKDLELTYNQFIKPLEKVKSVIQNKSLEHLGGWLSHAKNEQKSVYGNVLLAKSLIGNLERGRNVFLGFSIKDQKEWDQTIAACENDEQRSLIHYLRALEKNSIALDDMKAMYNLHPKSRALEILMTREMQKIELKYLGKKVKSTKNWTEDSNEKYGIPKSYILKYINKVKPFVKTIVAEKKCNNLSYWMMMDGYLEYMTNEHRAAQKVFSNAKKIVKKTTVLHDQIELLEFANLLSLRNTMNEKLEIQFGKILKSNKAFIKQPVYKSDFFMERMGSIYAEEGDVAKAYLCNYNLYGLKFFPNSKDAKAVLELFDKPDKNDFEKYLLEDKEIKTREEIIDILGTSYLGEEQIEKAIETFASIPDFGKKFKNPFRAFLFEQETNPKYSKVPKFSKYEIAQKIAELKNQISKNSNASAEAHLALGNYEYHSSYFGFAWQIKDYYKSVSSWGHSYDSFRQLGKWTKGDKAFMNLAPARKHLKKVLEISPDKELQAQAIIMLSQLEKINNHLKNIRDDDFKKHRSKYYANHLKTDYSGTEIYKHYIRECNPYNRY